MTSLTENIVCPNTLKLALVLGDFARPTWECESDPAQLIIGLDTSRIPVRLMVASMSNSQGQPDTFPQGTADFDSLADFSEYWTKNWSFLGIQIAVPAEEADPLGIRDWLRANSYYVEEYEWTAYRSLPSKDMILEDLGIGPAFQRAYALTVYACYRANAASVARGLWAKLFEVQHLLEDLRCDAQRLAGALSAEERKRSGWDEVPF